METSKDNDSCAAKEEEHSLGSYLKRMREGQGISLGAISKNTKIPVSNLELLEADAFDKLPDKIYIIGYVKSYSKAIGMTPDRGLHLLGKFYNDEHSYRRFAPGGVPKERVWEVFKEKNTKQINRKPIYGILIIVLGVLFIVSGRYLSRHHKEAEQRVPVINHKSINAETPLKDTAKVSINREELHASPLPQEETILTQETKEAKTEKTKEETVTKKTFMRMTSSLYSIDESVDEQEILKRIPKKIRSRTVSGMQNVYILAANEDSWMAYKSDDGPIKRFILKKGESTFLRGKEIRLFLGNYRGVQIFLNNRLLSMASRTRHKSLVFPQENRKKYLTPLFIYHDSGKVETSQEYIERTQSSETHGQS